MANMLISALASHHAALIGNRGDTITYQRGSESVSMTAVCGGTDLERADGDGVQVAFRSIDFIITASLLVLRGVTCKPKRGDRISHSSRTYEVLNVSGEQCYTEEPPSGARIRIHTKLIKDES